MGRMVDAVDPSAIPASLNGAPALRVTVLADSNGQAFDYETGNAGAPAVAASIRRRYGWGMWSVGYVNESQFPELDAALKGVGLGWTDAEWWPKPGVYLWAADPSRNIQAGRWRPPVTCLAVQDTYAGATDISTTAPNFPALVAGYLDGRISAWSAAQWARFRVIAGTPGPPPNGGHMTLAAPLCEAVVRPGHPGQGWRFGKDGGVFPYGGAPLYGTLANVRLAAPIAAAVVAETGYTMIGEDGGSFPFGPGAPEVPSLA